MKEVQQETTDAIDKAIKALAESVEKNAGVYDVVPVVEALAKLLEARDNSW